MSETTDHSRFHSWLLRLLPVGAVISVVAFLLGAVLLINSVRTGNQEQARTCRVAQRDTTILRNLLSLARKNAAVTLQNDRVRLKASRVFYREALALLKPIDCEKL
jgi:hypothetical protein